MAFKITKAFIASCSCNKESVCKDKDEAVDWLYTHICEVHEALLFRLSKRARVLAAVKPDVWRKQSPDFHAIYIKCVTRERI